MVSKQRFHRRMAGNVREFASYMRLVSNVFVESKGFMGMSAIRVAACAGVLVGSLMLGNSAVGPAVADAGDEQSSKVVKNDGAVQGGADSDSAGEATSTTPS
jgi:hypothetical protein